MQDPSVEGTKLASYPIKKKRKSNLRKAPQAPKRFKSSYILFFVHVQVKIKAELGGGASAPAVSKKASELWKTLSVKDRQYWDDEAAKERERYMAEKAAYNGIWHVPHKRAKKDPAAPKRNPSAFLLFAQGKRQELKKQNPDMKNTDISRMLGWLWRDTPIEEKRHHIERELEERKQYKNSIAEWKTQQETMQLTRKTGDTTSSLVSAIERDTGRSVQPIVLENGVTDRVHDRSDDVHDVYPYASQSYNTSNSYYGVNLYPPHIMLHGPHQHHQHQYAYPERSHEVRYINSCTQDVYPSAPGHHQQKQCSSLRQQHGNSSVNDRYFNPITFHNNYGSSQRESYAQQQQEEGENYFPPPSNNDLYLEYRQEDNAAHHHYYPKQQHQHAFEQQIGRDASSDHFDETRKQYAPDEKKQVDSNSNNLYDQDEYHHTINNRKEEYGNLDKQHLNQEPHQHDMDQNISHNMLDNTQQQNTPLRW